ncbi:hypothetical protein BGZ83_011858 [Gryganskiella cystojenkinii]|nr:hypothetical protein BGZ83_011858 [Gryganskiella cystojenkinii]
MDASFHHYQHHKQPETRTFDDAVLYSCGELHASDREKHKTLGTIEDFGLKFISIKDALGINKYVERCIGASTPSFVLTDASHSLATKIFLEAESLETGLKMAENRDTWSVSSSNLLYQL